MKLKLFTKFLFVYLAVAAAAFIIISTVGSALVNSYLTDRKSRSIYSLAQDLTSNFKDMTSFNSRAVYDDLRYIARCEDVRIMLIGPDGIKYMDTSVPFDDLGIEVIESFDPIALGKGYYTIGNFFGQFSEETMSVMQPVSINMSIRGYISVHMPMSLVYMEREALLGRIHMITWIVFALMIIVFVMQHIWIYRPLNKIIKGTKLMAAGDLSTKITAGSKDELEDLAQTLNYMGSELNKQTEYQRKFIANVSHDFRSPLTSIKGYVEAIRDGVIPPEMMGKYLDIIVSETERLNKLTRELLSLDNIDDRVRKMNYTSFNINKLIRDTALSFEGICHEKGISFMLLLEGDELNVFADYGKIQQVMYNLIDNAIKFSNANSSIHIETSLKKDKAYISVKDHGVGISNKEIAKIWQRFYKTDSSRGKDRTGTGLGLSIVKDIISSHNQKITCVSTEGVGTEFYFTLDLAAVKPSP